MRVVANEMNPFELLHLVAGAVHDPYSAARSDDKHNQERAAQEGRVHSSKFAPTVYVKLVAAECVVLTRHARGSTRFAERFAVVAAPG